MDDAMRPVTAALPEGTVTVLSTDLVGSSLLNQRLGDEAATAIERELVGVVLEQVEKERGALLKDTGDGLMVAFQSARRAVACAREIQRAIARRNRSEPDPPVHLRIGLHTGEVLSEDGALHGETLIVAKRIEAVAPAGGILASDTVYGVLGTARGELHDRGEFELKGIDARWQLWEVPWATPETSGVLAGRDRSPFVGRTAERARLERALERARAGSGVLMLVAGEAGVGKSRLVEETAAAARRLGLTVLTGHCVDQQGAQPYLPTLEHLEEASRQGSPEAFRRALGENAPEIAKLMPELRVRYADIPDPVSLPPEQERRHLLHGIAEFLERNARASPLLLVFEDLQWADESTLLLVRLIAQRVAQTPVLAVGTYRDTDLKPGCPLAATLPELLRQHLVEELRLGRLTHEGVAALLEGRAGSAPPAKLVSVIFAETEGNPFFVEELFRHLHEGGKLFDESGRWRTDLAITDTDVPRSVALVIGQRLERVSDDCRRILTIAALAGKAFRFDLLAGFPGVDEDDLLDALEEAAAAALVSDVSIGREARYAFVHEQIRQTLLSLLSTARRQRLHLRLADALETVHTADVEAVAPDIAYHLSQAGAAAGDAMRTVRWLMCAAERALEALAFEDALRDLDTVRTVLPRGEREVAVRVLRLRARALRGLARIEDALAAFAEALEIAPMGAERDAVLQARAQLELDLFRGREAITDVDPLLARARIKGDRAREVELLLMRSRGLYILALDAPAEHAGDMRASYEAVYALAKEIGDKRAMCQARIPTMVFLDYWHEYREEALRNSDEATALAAELGDEDLQIDATSARLRLLTPREAQEPMLRVRRQLEARRDPLRLKEHLFRIMWHHLWRAELEQAVTTCDAGIALSAQLGSPPVQYASIKGLALTELGRFDEAWASFQAEVADDAHPFGRCMRDFGIALWLEAIGALSRAEAASKAGLAEAERLSRTWMQAQLVDSIAVIAARRGPAGAPLAEWLGRKSEATGFHPSPPAQAEAAIARGAYAEALALADRFAEECAANWLERSAILTREVGLRALEGLGRHAELLSRAAAVLADAEKAGARRRTWRILATRARARDACGDAAGARDDRRDARAIVDEMAARIADPELRAAFESDPIAQEVRRP